MRAPGYSGETEWLPPGRPKVVSCDGPSYLQIIVKTWWNYAADKTEKRGVRISPRSRFRARSFLWWPDVAVWFRDPDGRLYRTHHCKASGGTSDGAGAADWQL